MEKQYLCRTLDMVMGPMCLSDLQQLIARGMLSPGDEYCEVGQTWSDISEFTTIRSAVSASRPEVAIEQPDPSRLIPLAIEPASSMEPHAGPQSAATFSAFSTAATTSREMACEPQSPPANNHEMRQLIAEYMHQHQAGTNVAPNVHDVRAVRGKTAMVADGLLDVLSAGASSSTSLLAALFRWKLLWLVVAIGVIAFTVPKISSRFQSTESMFETLEETFNEWRSLSDIEADEAEWADLRQRAGEKLEVLVPALEKKASSDDATSMSLLWIARDYLPQLLRRPDVPDPDVVVKIESHLEMVRRASAPVHSHSESDPWVTVIIIGDVMIIAVAVWWWIRRSRAMSSVTSLST